MGNCYNVDKKENDLINDIEHLQKINQNSKHLSENNIVDVKNDNNDIDINIVMIIYFFNLLKIIILF